MFYFKLYRYRCLDHGEKMLYLFRVMMRIRGWFRTALFSANSEFVEVGGHIATTSGSVIGAIVSACSCADEDGSDI